MNRTHIYEIINILQDFQNKFMLRFFEAPKQGTPTGIVELDLKMLLMKDRIMLSKQRRARWVFIGWVENRKL